MSPEIVSPDLVIELVTNTLMVGGTPLGRFESLPAVLVQVPPQVGAPAPMELANPLRLAGAGPPLSEFDLAHCDPQKTTCCPTTAFRSPITKFPAKNVPCLVPVTLSDPVSSPLR